MATHTCAGIQAVTGVHVASKKAENTRTNRAFLQPPYIWCRDEGWWQNGALASPLRAAKNPPRQQRVGGCNDAMTPSFLLIDIK
jgi:hypothetical protein